MSKILFLVRIKRNYVVQLNHMRSVLVDKCGIWYILRTILLICFIDYNVT